jgi:hypothetical protein
VGVAVFVAVSVFAAESQYQATLKQFTADSKVTAAPVPRGPYRQENTAKFRQLKKPAN